MIINTAPQSRLFQQMSVAEEALIHTAKRGQPRDIAPSPSGVNRHRSAFPDLRNSNKALKLVRVALSNWRVYRRDARSPR